MSTDINNCVSSYVIYTLKIWMDFESLTTQDGLCRVLKGEVQRGEVYGETKIKSEYVVVT